MTRTIKMTERAIAAKAKPTRADRRMIRNRKALLNAAEKIIAAKGFERVTIDEIAETADLAKGTFYNYFDDKNQIEKELALTIRKDLEGEVEDAQAGVEDPAGRLVTGICVFLRAAVTAPTHAAVVAQMYGQWLHPEAAGNARLRRDLDDGYRAGRFTTANLPAAIVMIVGLVQAGIMRALQLAERNTVRKLALALSVLALRALGMKTTEAQATSSKVVRRVFDRN